MKWFKRMVSGHLYTRTEKDGGLESTSSKRQSEGVGNEGKVCSESPEVVRHSWHQLRFCRKLRGRTQKVPTSYWLPLDLRRLSTATGVYLIQRKICNAHVNPHFQLYNQLFRILHLVLRCPRYSRLAGWLLLVHSVFCVFPLTNFRAKG